MCNYSDLTSLFITVGTFSEDGFKKAIAEGCRDMTVRTMKKKTNNVIKKEDLMNFLCDDSKYPGGESLLKLLKNYFKNPAKNQADYDVWHDTACQAVISCLRNFYQPISVTYGKAQKVVNIAMKNIFCLNGAEDYYKKHYFDYCHMALDSFILEWVYRKTRSQIFNNVKISRGNFISWSNISDSRQNINGKVVLSYQDIQNLIRKIDMNGLTPFEAEFYVWHQMQQTIAAEALFDPDLGGMTKKEFKDKLLSQKMSTLTALLGNINYSNYLI